MSIFSNITARRPQSSDFNLSHTRKFSMNAGICTPTLCEEILPSDKWNYAMSALVRFMPMQAPVMHMVDVYNYSFFVPARLTMKRGAFETFITGGKNGDGKDALGATVEIPYINVNFRAGSVNFNTSINYAVVGANSGNGFSDSLADFLGVAMGDVTEENTRTIKLNMMPFIAFWRIWCQYFRDQNLHPDYESLYPGIFDSTGDITAAVYTALVTNAADPDLSFPFFTLPRVCWEKDYFTSALPFAQRGNPVETPLSGNANVTYKPSSTIHSFDNSAQAASALQHGAIPAGAAGGLLVDGLGGGKTFRVENIDEIELSTGGFTINQLRLASRLQEWLEKMARGGARYIEQIKAHFGVTSSDARLQRPEFLGGGKIPVHISEVLQTSEDGTTTPLAAMAGHGVSSGNVNNFHRFFEEHGYVISVMFIRPKTAYFQGLARKWWNRFDKLEWAWPSFAHLGEQEVLNKEIYFGNGVDPVLGDNQTFGYQSRYAEYKYIPSTVHGDFKNTLLFWHWGRLFDTTPSLSPGFVESDPSNRIFNVIDESQGHMYCIVNNRIRARRPLPYFSSPTL